MEENKYVFNHLKFRKLIEDTFGPKSLSDVAKNIPVSRTTLYGWINDKNRNGPTGKSWGKIKNLFKKQNIIIKSKDFYEIVKEEETDIEKEKPYLINVCDDRNDYKKDNVEEYYQLLDKYLDVIKDQKECMVKKDIQIEQLTKETFDLKMKIQHFKKVLTDNGISYRDIDEI